MYNPLMSEQFCLNIFGNNVTIFNIAEGETIKEGDFVAVNTRTLMAGTPKKESGYCTVGCASRIVTNEAGQKMVICHDGIFVAKNTPIPEHTITEDCCGRACYFENRNTVSMDNINTTKAGEILSVDEKRILLKIDIGDRRGMEW
ncbi:MAG TPA: hypothetical protein DF613_14015 [Lachnospiraceae bacterium]|nr:hypothetical protein [Lachnospiraceae bacterium]